MNIAANRVARNGRQWLNDALATKAFDKGLANLQTRPVEIYLQVASGCNLDCYMCYEHLRPPETRHGRGLKILSPELYAKIEAEIFPYSSRVTFGVGGEPMLCPELPDYIERAHKANQHVHLMTNGTLITTSARAEILARCLSTMEISVDGATKETYERIRIGSKWESLLRNIDLLNEHRTRYAPEDRLHLSLCMVLMKSNVHELPQYVELAKEHHVDRVSAWHVIPVTEESKGEPLWDDAERADKFLREARQLAAEYGIEVDFVRPFQEHEDDLATDAVASRAGIHKAMADKDKAAQTLLEDEEAWARPLTGDGALPGQEPRRRGPRLHCASPVTSAFIFYDGRVFPCCHPLAHTKMHMGDLNEASFAEIWNNKSYRNLRAGLAQGDPPPLCQVCSIVHGHTGKSEDVLEGEDTDLASYYGDRDLAPLEESAPNVVDHLVDTGTAEHLAWLEDDNQQRREHVVHLENDRAALRRHVANLEQELRETRARLERIQEKALYKAAARVHGLVKKQPKR